MTREGLLISGSKVRVLVRPPNYIWLSSSYRRELNRPFSGRFTADLLRTLRAKISTPSRLALVPLCREPRLFLANPPRVLDPHFRQRSRLKRPRPHPWQTKLGAARWKEMMEKDFDLYYTPGINSPSPEMRTATAMQYAAY